MTRTPLGPLWAVRLFLVGALALTVHACADAPPPGEPSGDEPGEDAEFDFDDLAADPDPDLDVAIADRGEGGLDLTPLGDRGSDANDASDGNDAGRDLGPPSDERFFVGANVVSAGVYTGDGYRVHGSLSCLGGCGGEMNSDDYAVVGFVGGL